MPVLVKTGLRYPTFFVYLHGEHQYHISFVEKPRRFCVILPLIYLYRAAKHSAKLVINTYTADVQTTPTHEISRPDSPILSPGWSPGGDQFTTHGNN